MAQVYSVNAVGYVNVTLKKGYNLISNPLNNGGNTLAEIIPISSPLPDDTFVVTWDPTVPGGAPALESPMFYPGAAWEPAGSPIPPGKGFFIYINPATATQETYTITFVGEVPTGTLRTPIYGGARYNALASQVPQAGKVSADLGLVGAEDDMLLVWDKNLNPPGFSSVNYFFVEGNWTDMSTLVEPTVGVGDAFFLFRAAAGNSEWTRTFNVNTP
jgi:hypothetical protein